MIITRKEWYDFLLVSQGGGGILIEIIQRISHLQIMAMVTTSLCSELIRMNTMRYGEENLDTS